MISSVRAQNIKQISADGLGQSWGKGLSPLAALPRWQPPLQPSLLARQYTQGGYWV